MAEAGWFRDPGGAPRLRFFDGEEWTDEVQPFPAPSGPPTAPLDAAPPRESPPWWRTRRGALTLGTAGAILALLIAGVAAVSLDRSPAGEVAEPLAPVADAPPPPEPEPAEPEPEREFVELSSIDWLEETWTTNCSDDGSVLEVQLTREDGLGGVRRPEDGAFTPVYVVEIDDVVFGDVTGDGHDDAIFVTQCVWASAEYYLEVWSHDDAGHPMQLPPVHHYSKFEAVLDGVEAVQGSLRVHTMEGADGDDSPHLNGYPVEVITQWFFDGARWTSQETSREDTSPPPEPTAERSPEPEPAPAPGPEPLSACERLGSWISTDEEYCAEVLRGLEACERQMEADPNWIYSEDSGGWENVQTGDWQPPCDI